MIILDGNLSDDLLAKIFNSFGDNSIIAVDTVSSMKAQRFIPYLSKINLIKCNRAEANILISAEEHLSLQQISEKLIYSGIGTAIVSDSLDGFIVSTRKNLNFLKPKNLKVATALGQVMLCFLVSYMLSAKVRLLLKLQNLVFLSQKKPLKLVAPLTQRFRS